MKTVLITGGSRGIGRAMVERFSKEGYAVAFTYKSNDAMASMVASETGALAIKADSMNESEVKEAVLKVRETLGPIDVLINNAAVASFSMFTDITYECWNETLGVSLTGAFLYSKEVVSDMVRKKQGRIINISSMWGVVGSSCEVHYSAAKAGLIGLTKALAKELGPSGVTVNAIAPGVIDTDMNASLSEDELTMLKYDTPLMRIGKPEEVASCALFLASDDAAFVTGEVMNVSGGYFV